MSESGSIIKIDDMFIKRDPSGILKVVEREDATTFTDEILATQIYMRIARNAIGSGVIVEMIDV